MVNDVSEHQGAIDWAAYRAARQAVILRAHNGSRADTRFAANRSGADPLALVGAYQYLVAGRDAATQAREYLSVVGHLEAHEVPILDIEEGGDLGPRAAAWLRVVEAAVGRPAMVYSGDNLWGDAGLSAAVGGRPRWVARYSANPPVHRWDVWQRSSTATVSGVTGQVDESVYPGDIAGLRDLLLEDDMPMTGPEFARLYLSALRDTVDTGQFGNDLWHQLRRIAAEGAKDQAASLTRQVAELSAKVDELQSAVTHLSTVHRIAFPELAGALAAHLPAVTEKDVAAALTKVMEGTPPSPHHT